MSDEGVYQMVPVADVFLLKDTESGEFVGIDMAWGENVLNADGAAQVLDMLKANMDSTPWLVTAVSRAERAQAKTGGETGRGDDDGHDGEGD